ncbi:DUF4419 domain-containing protein [Nostoc sp. 106C]|uniref:DUF4419 domain-containing protein n=1 Tax=Nostoc sp. 106C TaxID=1932667 RepID=UPI000A39DF6C|nr:DUF4419 domain-containing protein [Nostoc sp. 106C]OUL25765.1 hypothetical protein BV375_22310 [Nostoc sp. 106C]
MSVLAPILEQTAGKIRFGVDDVKSAQERLPTKNAKFQLEKQLGKPLLAFSHDDTFEVIPDQGIHPLALAVHAAFSEHRPLLLTPDIIWITLAQGFAQHINNHAETLRSRLVRHQGKEKLIVGTQQINSEPQHWSETVQKWALQIRDRVGADLYRLLECNFSTTTPITQTASHVVMMNAFQQYFDYAVSCVCGIPEITLLGTVEDWQSICDRVQMMAKYDLEWWTARLLPICREFVETASGKPSLEFWRCIYKPEPVYGAELITGWLTDLFPYLRDLSSLTKAASVRNWILEIDRCELPNASSSEAWFEQVIRGISAERLPLGISQAPFELITPDEKEYSLELLAGFIGVHQDSEQQTLQPEIGWILRERSDRFAQLLDNIQQQHLTQPPVNRSELYFSSTNVVPKEHIQILERFDGATLYANSGHSWQIPKYIDKKDYTISNPISFRDDATHLIDLEDGRCIAYVYKPHKNECLIFVGGKPSLDREPLQDPVIIAHSIPELLERIFQAQGRYYFDDANFVC